MIGESHECRKYVVLLFLLLALLVFGNLVIEFNISDLAYLLFIFVTALRYLKIQISK